MNSDLLEMLYNNRAILEGHFLLTSGRHSDKYIEKFRVLEDPKSLTLICSKMANSYKNKNIDIVLGAAIGGIVISAGVGRILNVKHIFTERVDNIMSLRRGFILPEGSRVLIVEDIVTTGGSIRELIEIVEEKGGEIIGIQSILDRNENPVNFGYIYQPLLQFPVKSWNIDDCPDWLLKIPVTKPGSSGRTKNI